MSRIDFHVHVTPPEIIKNWRKYAESEPHFSLLSNSPHNKFAAAEDVITMLEENKFDRAVVFGFSFNDMGLCRMVNDYVIENIRLHPEKLAGFMSVSPGSKELEKEIDRCCGAGLKGIGELFPQGQNFDIADKKQTQAISGICAERKLPLILHANEPVGHYYAGKEKTGLRQIERFIENNQELKIILAHFGGALMFYETMPEMQKKCRNVYYDTAAAPCLYDERIYMAANALGLCEKILFGSDFPLLPPSRYLKAIETLPEYNRGQILGANAEKLLY